MNFCVYILRCSDGSYYTGQTDNLEKRIAEHTSGAIPGCYTFKRRPLKLVFSNNFPTRSEALTSERQIKGWSRKKKEAMMRSDWKEVSRLARSSFDKDSSLKKLHSTHPEPVEGQIPLGESSSLGEDSSLKKLHSTHPELVEGQIPLGERSSFDKLRTSGDERGRAMREMPEGRKERKGAGWDQRDAVKESFSNQWTKTTVGEQCIVIAGQSPQGKFYNNTETGLPFYQGKKEFNKKFIGTPKKWTSHTTKEALAGDILMSVRAPVGPINFSTQKICIGRGLAAIRVKDAINNQFLFYALLSKQDEISGSEGAVFASISKKQIENIRLFLPPLPEQKRIVAILDVAFAGINQAVINTERNLANARELFESNLNNIFTQKGEGWVEKPLGEVCILQRGFDLPKRQRSSGDFPLVSSSGVIDTHIESKVKGPGVVTGRSGSIGNVSFIEQDYWPLNTALYVKEFFDNKPYFIYYLLKQFDLNKYASGAGVPTLNRNNVHNIHVSIPFEVSEQEQITKQLDELLTKTQHLETIYQKKLTALAELRESILQKAFAGELTSDTAQEQVSA